MTAAGIDLVSANGAAIIAACWLVGCLPFAVLLGKVIGERDRALADLAERDAINDARAKGRHPARLPTPGLAPCGHLVIVKAGEPLECPMGCAPAHTRN